MSRIASLCLSACLAVALAWSLPVAAQKSPAGPRMVYLAVFGIYFAENGDVNQLRLVKVVDPRKGNADAEGVTIPDEFVESVRKLLTTKRYRPKLGEVKPEEVFTYFFFDPDQPARADYDPRPRSQ